MTTISRAEATERVARGERKEWARERFHGLENLLMPSFTPDFKDLDEEGIRIDVRQSIAHRFFSVTGTGLGLSEPERRRFMEIIADEARGKVLVGSGVGGATMEENLESIRFAEELGCSHLLVSPRSIPGDAEALYRWFAEISDATELGLVLYINQAAGYGQFHPSRVPFDVFDRVADLPNVVAAKLTMPINPVTAYQCCEVLADRLLMGVVNLDLAPTLARDFRVQWSGAWIVESTQSPERPYGTEFINLLGAGRMDEALRVYWQMEPLYRQIFDLQAPLLRKGAHPWAHMKYMQWCVGGNGGLIRDGVDAPGFAEQARIVPDLTAEDRRTIQETYRAVGITPREGDEEFAVGRAAYACGTRMADLSKTPFYV
jgi:4-hydroxy-tetrahydrodipicolinate synthase